MRRCFVYNANSLEWFGNLVVACKAAARNNYSFVLFNDIIYFVLDQANIFKTPLTLDDLI